MLPHIDLPRALVRGRYMAAAASMEHVGTPIDVPMLNQLRQHWTEIRDRLIADIDSDYHVYEGRTFKTARFEDFLARNNIPWARLESGALDLSDNTFREAARAYPIIAPLRELRRALSSMRLADLAVGKDGRNRSYCQHSGHALGAASRATQSSFLDRVSGCAGWSNRRQAMVLRISTGLNKSSVSQPCYPAT